MLQRFAVPAHARKRFRCVFLKLVVCLALAGLASAAAASDSPWLPVPPEELAATWKPLEPDTAAELLLWRTDVDDKRFPQDRRTTEYRRYKIVVPEKADAIMRISRTEVKVNGFKSREYEIRARLTQPNGTSKELGKESILARPLTKTRADPAEWQKFGTEVERTEKYLAVSGAEAGAILEVQIVTRERRSPIFAQTVLQLEGTPVHRLEYTFRAGNESEYEHRMFVLNIAHAKSKDDPKNHAFTITATDLPALVNEPYSGAKSDYALTVFSSYTAYSMGALSDSGSMSRVIDPKAGPWAVFASVMRWIEEDRSAPTAKIKKAAAELTQTATSELEKARRLHQRVQASYQDFAHRARSRESATQRSLSTGPSLDQVLDLGKDAHPDLSDIDFLYLALSLYRAAGLKAELLLLPDREFARLDRRLVSQAFLPEMCIAVSIDNAWYFSMPGTKAMLPFGTLPWQYQGQGGLLARANRQDFIDVPLDAPDKSVITCYGVFTLDEQGTLSGDFRRSFTGQHAYALRNELNEEDQEHQHVTLKNALEHDLKGAELQITNIANLSDPQKPVDITYHLNWPGYAVLTSDRLIVRPSVMRAQASPPFTAATRRNRIVLPFRWQEIDRLVIQLPPGYQPESMAMPPSYPGDVLGYKVVVSFEAPKRLIHLRREFQSAAIMVPTEAYPDLKKWHDAVSSGDQHELVFIKADSATATPAETKP
jgi:hypothetical protein